MKTKICFCGELVVDFVEAQEGTGSFSGNLGGAHYNSAMGLARAIKREGLSDIESVFVGSLSTDMFGQRFMQSMQENGVNVSYIKPVDHNTTLAMVSIRPGKENAFSFYRQGTTAEMTSADELPQSFGADVSNLICCFGSISTIMDPARTTWKQFALNQKNKALVFYDLNARPAIAKDVTRYQEMLREWAAISDVVKASDADLAWSYPGLSFQEVANLWFAEGAKMAVITKGMNGSEVFTPTLHASAATLDLVARNTIGAGDNFNAGLALGLTLEGACTAQALQNLDQAALTRIIQKANETAAYHLISIGAQPRAKTGTR